MIIWRPDKTHKLTRRQFVITGGKAVLVTLVVGTLSDLVAACRGEGRRAEEVAPSGQTRPVARGGTLRYATLGDVDYGSLDMTTTTGTNDLEIGASMNEPYIWLLPDGSFAPGLAESWEVSKDGLEYTFRLRKDVTFHDGTPLDAEAAKYNFDRMTDRKRNPTGLSYSYLGAGQNYEGTYVVDKYTFKIRLTQPNPIFLYRIRRKYVSPQSPTAIEKFGSEYYRNPVGCGPFKFVEWVQADHVTVEAYPDYKWGPPQLYKNAGRPYLDRVVYRIFKDPSTKAAALEAGEVDYAAGLDPADIVRFQGMKDIVVVLRDKMGQSVQLQLNVEKPPTNELAVRQAISVAINREALVKSVLFDLVEPAYHIFTKNLWSYDPSLEALNRYDPRKAETVLEQAGWRRGPDGIRQRDGTPLKLIYLAEGQPEVPLAQFIQAELRKVGIDVEIKVLQGAGWLEAALRGEHNMTYGRRHWIQEDPDVLRNWAHSSLINVRQNYIRARNEELDRLLERGISLPGDAHSPEREAIYKQAQKIIMENYYVVPLYYNRSFEAHRTYVHADNIGYDPYGTYHEWVEVWLEK
jgi:peptide/nickel transport system substrate-binding protein